MASLRSGIATVVLMLGAAPPLAAQPGAEAEIRALVQAEQVALNARDAAAYGRYLEPDADVVTAFGWRVKGRDAYAQRLADAFRTKAGSGPVQAEDVGVAMLAPDVALVHVTWAAGNVSAIDTQIVRRAGDRWLIAASQETDVAPERATSAGQAAGAVPHPARRCLLADRAGKCLMFR